MAAPLPITVLLRVSVGVRGRVRELLLLRHVHLPHQEQHPLQVQRDEIRLKQASPASPITLSTHPTPSTPLAAVRSFLLSRRSAVGAV